MVLGQHFGRHGSKDCCHFSRKDWAFSGAGEFTVCGGNKLGVDRATGLSHRESILRVGYWIRYIPKPIPTLGFWHSEI